MKVRADAGPLKGRGVCVHWPRQAPKLVRVRVGSSQRKELAMAHPQFGLQQESGEAAAEADEFMKCRRGGNGALSCGL